MTGTSYTQNSQCVAGFETTHWGELEAARTTSPEHRQAVLENLCRRYWKPVCHYLRAGGKQDAEALDMTQEFFVRVVLGRDLFASAERERGSFRTYLLHCLKNFARDWQRRSHAQCREPGQAPISLEACLGTDTHAFEPPAAGATPEDVFHNKWAATLIERALERLGEECMGAGLVDHLDIFHRRVVRPTLGHAAPAALEGLARRYGLTEKQVCNRTQTIRRRFSKLLLGEVRMTVASANDAEDELRALLGYVRREAHSNGGTHRRESGVEHPAGP